MSVICFRIPLKLNFKSAKAELRNKSLGSLVNWSDYLLHLCILYKLLENTFETFFLRKMYFFDTTVITFIERSAIPTN